MDKSCKSVIKYFLSHGDTAKCFYNSEYVYQTKKQSCFSFQSLAEYLGLDEESLHKCIRYMEESGWIEYQNMRTSNRSIRIGFFLSHKGKNYKYFRRQEVKKYIAEKWIDFFSLLLSVAALIISIISLLQPKSGQ